LVSWLVGYLVILLVN